MKTDYLNVLTIENSTSLSPNATRVRTEAFQHFAAANGTVLLAIGTYMFLMTLAKFKQSRAFTRRVSFPAIRRDLCRLTFWLDAPQKNCHKLCHAEVLR